MWTKISDTNIQKENSQKHNTIACVRQWRGKIAFVVRQLCNDILDHYNWINEGKQMQFTYNFVEKRRAEKKRWKNECMRGERASARERERTSTRERERAGARERCV